MSSSRIRIMFASMLAVFAVSAVAASTASARRVWTVGGANLAVGQTRSLRIVKNSPAILKAGAEEEECKKISINAGNTIDNVEPEVGKGTTGRDHVTLTFTECRNVGKPLCVVTTAPFNTPTFLVENAAGTIVYDSFRPEGAAELTPKQVTEKGEPASKENEEKLKTYVSLQQKGTGCTAPEITKIEGNGIAAEISPQGESAKHKLIFPCPTPVTPVNLWNGVKEVNLKLKGFGVATKWCIEEIEVELTTGDKFGVK